MPEDSAPWSASHHGDPTPPVDIPGSQPINWLPSDALAPMAAIPEGAVTRWLLDGQPIDLFESRLERWSQHGDHVALTFIVPAGDSPITGVPLRLTLVLDGPTQVTESGRWATDKYHPTMHVEGLEWSGGRFTAKAWTQERDTGDDFKTVTWQLQIEQPTTVTATVEELNLARPPYLLLMPEVFTDGVWDLATIDSTIMDLVDVDELDLPSDLKKRIRRWNGAWESAATQQELRLQVEAEEIVAAIQLQMPGTIVAY